MKNKLSIISRFLLLICTAGLVMVLYKPIWRIELNAPQYPEGLALNIYAKGLKGNVDIINGLNHYIGMKTLHNEDFVEFTVLPYCIIFFAIAFGSVALINRRKWLNILLISFICFGIIAMIDFWRWEYNYGHNLNPNAAIIVPGMAYQPPLIGYKQLLNFGAYSIPDIGGWIFIGVGAILLGVVFMEWLRRRQSKMKPVYAFLVLLLAVSLSSCNTGPEQLNVGKDNCYVCKMTISDPKYGAEVVTNKGKLYKFDDIYCLLSFTRSDAIEKKAIRNIYVSDFGGKHELINTDDAFFLKGEMIHAPMNGNIIAFSNKDSIQLASSQLQSKQVAWNDLFK